MAQRHFDILYTPIWSVVAVNAIEEEDGLTCGAFYVQAGLPNEDIRLADGTTTLTVLLPSDLLRREHAYVGWNVKLKLDV